MLVTSFRMSWGYTSDPATSAKRLEDWDCTTCTVDCAMSDALSATGTNIFTLGRWNSWWYWCCLLLRAYFVELIVSQESSRFRRPKRMCDVLGPRRNEPARISPVSESLEQSLLDRLQFPSATSIKSERLIGDIRIGENDHLYASGPQYRATPIGGTICGIFGFGETYFCPQCSARVGPSQTEASGDDHAHDRH